MAKVVTQKKQYVPRSAFSRKSRYSDYVKLSKEYFGEHPSTLADEYNKKKKPKKLSRLIVNTLVICSLVIFVVVSSVVCSIFAGGGSGGGYVDSGKENVHNFVGLCIEPDFPSAEKIDVSSLTDAKSKAAYLYEISSRNVTATPYFTAYNKGLLFMRMGSSDNYIDIDAVTLKTQREYFNIEYHLKNSVPILDSFIGEAIAKTTDVITTARHYARAGDDYTTYQKVKNNGYDEQGVPYANWDATIAINTPEVKKLPMTVFNASQGGNYRITKHVITVDTISDAEVAYDARLGFYTVSITLDHTNPATVVYSLDDIRAGTGDTNASYSQIKIDFTVWDTGYFRTFSLLEKWNANMLISLGFQLETNWQCSYNELDCKPDRYHDSKIMKQFLGL